MIWILLAGLIVFLTWYAFVRPLNYFTKLGIKQAKPWPILGDLWPSILKIKGMGDGIESLYNMYPTSRYMGIYLFTNPTLLIRDPELIKQITVKDFDHFTDHHSLIDPEVDPVWGANVFSLRGQKWREMRATLSGSFTSSKMKHMFSIINAVAENFVKYFSDKNENLLELEMKDKFTRYTTDVIASSVFGIKVDSLAEPNNAFYTMGKRITTISGLLTRVKIFMLFAMPTLFRALKISLFEKDLAQFFRGIISETIQAREEKGIVRKDLIDLLLEARKGIKNEETVVTETGFAIVKESNILDKHKFKQLKSLSNDEITSQALVFFFAGFDTISSALCFGTYELAVNRDIQEKLRKEIRETHKANNGELTYEVLIKMKYMDMVISEVLRKWPPVIILDRVCTKPYTIEPIHPDEKPVHLKVGDFTIYPPHALHRDHNYHTEPKKFDPERFSDENKNNIRPYTYLPFGAGPRNCIGSRFAILEAKTVLYHLLLNFEIVPTEKTHIPLKLAKSLLHTSEGGFWLGLQRIQV